MEKKLIDSKELFELMKEVQLMCEIEEERQLQKSYKEFMKYFANRKKWQKEE